MDAMLRGMSFEQLQEWMVYAELEPFDEERADLRSASVVTAIHNVFRDRKKRRKPWDTRDFQLLFGDSKKPIVKKAWQSIKATVQMLFPQGGK